QHREDALADYSAADASIPKLQNLLSQYNIQDIYNMDETVLFYCLEPDSILANKKDWMTEIIFSKWIQEFDQKMNRYNVVLLIDGAMSYKLDNVTLENTKLFQEQQVNTEVDRYFDENTVNKLPMDQGTVDLLTLAEDTDPDSSEKEE
ncbi:14501_t:CDS:2, partial [Dentiscutata erythropus]